ncbi:hypothetical protein J6590_043292, partial [Homalodisca vitripennis]
MILHRFESMPTGSEIIVGGDPYEVTHLPLGKEDGTTCEVGVVWVVGYQHAVYEYS